MTKFKGKLIIYFNAEIYYIAISDIYFLTWNEYFSTIQWYSYLIISNTNKTGWADILFCK